MKNILRRIAGAAILMMTGEFFMTAQTVRLKAASMFQKSQETGLDYVLRLDADRLLSPCYTALGSAPKARPYGGWESRQIQGHSLGHYLSALSAFYDSTGSAEARQKLDYVVECLKSIQRKDGYLGGIPSTPFDTAFSGNFEVERFSLAKWWVPWYSVHKIYAGLIDAYTLGGNRDALEVVLKMADWAEAGSRRMSDEQFQKMLTCEHGGMCKVFADLYAITKEEKYLKMAERFVHQEIFRPLAKKTDRLQGYHANTQMPKILGLARLYEVTGREEYRTAAEFFFDTVTNRRSYVIGGNSRGEHFGAELDEPLERDTCETCNTYNMLELAEHIFSWNRNSLSADYYERALYNHILASQDPDSGAKTYFVSMMPGFFKVYGSFENAFWCCTGTGMENPARYNRFIVRDEGDTVYVNLFIPADAETKDGWKFRIETEFPYKNAVTVQVLKKGAGKKTLKVRCPAWDAPLSARKEGDGYLTLSAAPKEGDVFSISLSPALSCRRTQDRRGNFSVLYGPVVLGARLGTKGMPADIVDDQLVYMTRPALKVPAITADPLSPEKWVSLKDASALVFETAADACAENRSFELRPFYAIHHERYTVYFNAENPAEDERELKFRDITSDFIECGRQQSEMDHHYRNSGTEAGYIAEVDRSYRTLTGSGDSFEYRMKFDAKKKAALSVALYGRDSGGVKVFFEDTLLGEISAESVKSDSVVDYEIPVPQDLIQKAAGTRASVRVRIRFEQSGLPPLRILEVRSVAR